MAEDDNTTQPDFQPLQAYEVAWFDPFWETTTETQVFAATFEAAVDIAFEDMLHGSREGQTLLEVDGPDGDLKLGAAKRSKHFREASVLVEIDGALIDEHVEAPSAETAVDMVEMLYVGRGTVHAIRDGEQCRVFVEYDDDFLVRPDLPSDWLEILG